MNKLKIDVAQASPVDSAVHVAQPLLDSLSKNQLSMMAPLGVFGTAVLDAWGDLLREWSDFLAERIRRDVETQHLLLHCTNPAQLQALQAAWLQTAIDEYQTEAGRMTGLGSALLASVTGKPEVVA